MNFASVKKITIPEGKVKRLLSGASVLWKGGHTNLVPLSTEADGKTIYNGGLGYKEGYRVRSGGAEAVNGDASCTGFMPVKGLSVIRIAGCEFSGNVDSAINVADASFTNIGQVAGNGASYGIFLSTYSAYNSATMIQKDGFWQWIVPPEASGVKYIRVTAATTDGSKLIVTVDEEIEV